jgi:hypothetical protein
LEKLTDTIIYKQETDEYIFTTIAGITYTCYFYSVADIFSGFPDVASFIYGFNLDVVEGNVKKQSVDDQIGHTVFSIVEKFLRQNTAAVVYLCDTTDSRQALRKRKFDSWFKKSDTSEITKVDGRISIDDSTIYNTLLIADSNPLAERIKSVFILLNEKAKGKISGE